MTDLDPQRDATAHDEKAVHASVRLIESLRLSERRFAELVRTLPVPVFRSDSDGKWTFLNPAWSELTARPGHASLGRPVADSFVHEDRPLVAELLGRLRRREDPVVQAEVRILTDIGEPRWVTLKALIDEESGGALGTLSDIDTHKQIEDALTRARSAADQANQLKSSFLSSMSHELRTPLSAILGFSQLLAGDPHGLDEKGQRWIHSIYDAGKQLLGLIDEILDLSRIESGRMEFRTEAFHLGPLLREVVKSLEPTLAERGLTIATDLPDRELILFCDPTRVKQVLLNILGNSIKYGTHGSCITVRARPRLHAARLSILDPGPGRPTDKSAILASGAPSAHERAPSSGSGIGLTISKQVVEAMGGAIGYEARSEGTSEFWVELPLHAAAQEMPAPSPKIDRPAAPTPEPAPLAPASPAAGTEGGAGCTILYIEDNPQNIALMEAVLSVLANVQLLCAENGLEGVDHAAAQLPDLIFLDINLPDMDGFEVLRRLRADATTASIPIIAFTARAMAGDAERALRSGFDAYVTKPFTLRQVSDVLARYGPTEPRTTFT
ncbi:MAG: PAS domain-containing hybrid sensor histidine kinase/response regulator [Planctomycetota bacterium]